MEILLDVWEGSLDINEQILKDGGVAGLIIRLNDMNGGHHMDENFWFQWNASKAFLRGIYFVYNPWATGLQNYIWLIGHLPLEGVTRLFIDIEVRKAGYAPETYAKEVESFMGLIRQKYPLTVIYTGGWFLSVLSYWPKGSYWWARYPWDFYPDSRENWTWEQLHQKMEAFGYHADPLKQCPGTADLWQCSGDRLILPGTVDRPMDINMWAGDYASLEAWWGSNVIPPDPEPGLAPTKYVIINTAALNMRAKPSAQSADIGTLKLGDDVPVMEEKDGFYRIEGWISKTYTNAK